MGKERIGDNEKKIIDFIISNISLIKLQNNSEYSIDYDIYNIQIQKILVGSGFFNILVYEKHTPLTSIFYYEHDYRFDEFLDLLLSNVISKSQSETQNKLNLFLSKI
jgi:hypothetical protein